MSERLTTLDAWAAEHYAIPPSIYTLRRWVREGRIYPLPEKHGRTYYVLPSARYVDDFNDPSLVGAVHGATPARQ